MEKIKFTVSIRINKPVEDVFNAFVDNSIICKYFTTGASAPIIAKGDKIQWQWGNHTTDIVITEFVKNKIVEFDWPGYKVDYNTHVKFEFTEKDGSVIVYVTEENWAKDDAGINSALANNGGWTDMLKCMKAWVVYGVDLRK